jgi:hypothetical protein
MSRFNGFVGLALTALAGCGGEPIDGSLELTTDTAALSSTFSYGQHHPQGEAAMAHLYGPDGTWKPMTNIQYIWNYYSQYATPAHPADKEALIAYADGTRNTTARDANGHLLLDANHDGVLDTSSGGYAFHEHNGIGIGGAQTGTPFTQFWFDDNWLARYASQAYQRPLPQGLSSYPDFTRWRILGGDATAWSPYSGSAPDQLALNGLYSLAVGSASSAMSTWRRLRDNSGYRYDGPSQRYIYPDIEENYHLGLFKLLTDNLLVSSAIAASDKQELVDHSMALRSNILSNQERSGSTFLGWRSNIHDTDTLINTESVTVNALALGASSKYVFEAGRAPLLSSAGGYFLRPHNVLSADISGGSRPGHMTYGPYWTLPVGTYDVDFFLRAPSPSGAVATVDVYDSSTGQVLVSRVLNSADLTSGNRWTRVTLRAQVSNPSNSLELRVWWHGGSNLDVACIAVR